MLDCRSSLCKWFHYRVYCTVLYTEIRILSSQFPALFLRKSGRNFFEIIQGSVHRLFILFCVML